MTVSDMIKWVSLSNQSKTFIQNSHIDLYCNMHYEVQFTAADSRGESLCVRAKFSIHNV